MARLSEHPDAHFLVSLFLEDAPAGRVEAGAVFAAHLEDARCMCLAWMCGVEPQDELLRQSAEGGYAWGQALHAHSTQDEELLGLAVAQGEPEAMAVVMSNIESGSQGGADLKAVTREAAMLGQFYRQCEYADKHCVLDSVEQKQWLRRAAMQDDGGRAHGWMLCSTTRLLPLYDQGAGGRALFEIGRAFSFSPKWECEAWNDEQRIAARRVIELYSKWTNDARRAVGCWLWLSRHLGVARDIRLLIADLVWDDRAAWSERRETFE